MAHPTDDDVTPKKQWAPLYLTDNGSSPTNALTDPRNYFRNPSPLAMEICEANMRDGGSHAPFIAVAELAARAHRMEQFRRDTVVAVNAIGEAVDPRQFAALKRLIARVKKYLIGAAISAAGSLGTGAIYVVNQTSARAAETQKLLDDERELQYLRQQVDTIRLELGHRSSFDHRPSTDHAYLTPPAAPASLAASKGPSQ